MKTKKNDTKLYIVHTKYRGIRLFCEQQLHKAKQLSAMTGNKIYKFSEVAK